MNSRPARHNAWILAAAAIVTLASGGTTIQWRDAVPPYQFEFPRDHFNHPEYQTEWWYYTGNLAARDGHRYGFELTFFRAGLHPPAAQPSSAVERSVWNPDPVYLAHLALTDIDGRRFYHTERMNRKGPGLAGAGLDEQRIWNGNWQVRWTSLTNNTQHLEAVCDRFQLQLDLQPAKPAVINGLNGVSQKGPKRGEASHYLSFTRLEATGTLGERSDGVSGKLDNLSVTGTAWMDHEFFTSQKGSEVAGWDWFAVQLKSGEELMLYRLRSKSGGTNGFSSGTFVGTDGRSRYLSEHDFTLAPGRTWKSPQSKAVYPLEWNITVPSLRLTLREKPAMDSQELLSASGVTPSYWEGAVRYEGTRASQPVEGVGYLEMTGYNGAVFLAPR